MLPVFGTKFGRSTLAGEDLSPAELDRKIEEAFARNGIEPQKPPGAEEEPTSPEDPQTPTPPKRRKKPKPAK